VKSILIAAIVSLGVSILFTPYLIRIFSKQGFGQEIREDGPAHHKKKRGTPTMGGTAIIIAMWAGYLVSVGIEWFSGGVGPTSSALVLLYLTTGMGLVGFLDDYLKITRRSHHGLIPRYKMAGQIIVALGVGVAVLLLSQQNPPLYNTRLIFPFFKNLIPDLGWFYIAFTVLVLVGASNAVNLTDGLDGLAISTFAVSAAAFTALAYVTGHAVLAQYLLLVRFAPAGELTVFCGALVGASLGFLWYNSYPADIFMGDVGSLALGGALGTVAILIKQELLLPIVGGVFVMEALSVIIQVASFKITGQRVFKMAPIHHHFELIGWSEPKVIARFLIMAIIFALFSLTTLKLR